MEKENLTVKLSVEEYQGMIREEELLKETLRNQSDDLSEAKDDLDEVKKELQKVTRDLYETKDMLHSAVRLQTKAEAAADLCIETLKNILSHWLSKKNEAYVNRLLGFYDKDRQVIFLQAILEYLLFGVKPNITTLAKGLAGGVPVGACLADETCCDVLTKSTHGSTFGGNPLACAGGNVVLSKVSDPEFISEINRKAELFRKLLSEIDEVEGVDGLGLMIGVRLKTKKAADVLAQCAEKGLLILTAKEKLRFLPPLNISDENIINGMKIVKEVLDN